MSQDQNNNRIYDKLDKLDEKFDRKSEKIERRLDGVERELVIYNEQLKTHIEGVRQLKEENLMLREYIDVEKEKLEHSLNPVIIYVDNVKKTLSFVKRTFQMTSYIVTAIGTLLGIIYTIKEILGK